MDISPMTNKPKSTTKLDAKQKKLIAVLVIILVIIGLLAGGYRLAYNKGFKAGEAKGRRAQRVYQGYLIAPKILLKQL